MVCWCCLMVKEKANHPKPVPTYHNLESPSLIAIIFLIQLLPIEQTKSFAILCKSLICGVRFTSHLFWVIITWKHLNLVSILNYPISNFWWCRPFCYSLLSWLPGEILPLFLTILPSLWRLVEGWIMVFLIYCRQMRRWWYQTCQCQEKQIVLDKWMDHTK